MWIVEYTVKGSRNLKTRVCPEGEEQANAFAEKWRRSNSSGDYQAWVMFSFNHSVA